MLSDENIESAAEVVATALERFGPKTRLAQGLIAVAALEDAAYIVEKLDPGPPDLGDHLGMMLKASLSDAKVIWSSPFAAEQTANIIQGKFRR